MALGLLLSGCSTGPAAEAPTSAPTVTPPADPKEIAADIAATFPTEAEWLENYETGELCTAEIAGLTSCGQEVIVPVTSSRGKGLREGVTAVTAAVVALNVAEFGTDEVAEEWAGKTKAADILFTGDFDIPANAETKSAGARGTGTLVDFARDGWAGYRMSQVSEATGFDGSARDPATSTNSIVMTNGPLRFSLSVYFASAEPGAGDAETDAWLDRVFGPEETD
ncbi:hypothetical protein [Cryobacterium sp. N22]|uniref:hypothetical protein n=1 Tax=Cryobacterium sp. N22 TaxID=2048290 RepID=UPI0011B04F6E|nr:hypothetical protein [Cryobacterium sp. N22]